MSNVIQFLESMGKDAALGNMSPEEYTAAVKALDVDDLAQHALLNRNQDALNESVGNYTKMMMLLLPAEDDDQGEGNGKEDDDKDDGEGKKDQSSAN